MLSHTRITIVSSPSGLESVFSFLATKSISLNKKWSCCSHYETAEIPGDPLSLKQTIQRKLTETNHILGFPASCSKTPSDLTIFVRGAAREVAAFSNTNHQFLPSKPYNSIICSLYFFVVYDDSIMLKPSIRPSNTAP